MKKLINKIMGWINEKRIETCYKKEDLYRYKRLMAAENDPQTQEELREFLKEFQVSNIDYMFFWQKLIILAVTAFVELALVVLTAVLVFRIEPRPNIDPLWVLLGGVLVFGSIIDIWVIWSLMDKIDEKIYDRRVKKMEAKLASEPVV